MGAKAGAGLPICAVAVGADVGWLLVDDRPQYLTAVMDDAEEERRVERYMQLSRQAWKERYKA